MKLKLFLSIMVKIIPVPARISVWEGVLLVTSEMFSTGAIGSVVIVLTSGREHLEIKSACRVVRIFSV